MVVRLPTIWEEAPDHNVNHHHSGCWERSSIFTKYKTSKICQKSTKSGIRMKVEEKTNATKSPTKSLVQSLPTKKNAFSQSFTLLAMMDNWLAKPPPSTTQPTPQIHKPACIAHFDVSCHINLLAKAIEAFDRCMAEQSCQQNSQQSLSLMGCPMIEASRQFTPTQGKHHQCFDPSTGVLFNSQVKFERTSIQEKLAQTLQAFKTRMEARNQSNLCTEYTYTSLPGTTEHCPYCEQPHPETHAIVLQISWIFQDQEKLWYHSSLCFLPNLPLQSLKLSQPEEIPELSTAIKFLISQK